MFISIALVLGSSCLLSSQRGCGASTMRLLLFPLAALGQLLLPNMMRNEFSPQLQGQAEQAFTQGGVTLADVIPIDRSLTIYADLARSLGDVQQNLGDDRKQYVVLAPQNAAIMALGRKPWDQKLDPDGRIDPPLAALDEGSAEENIRRFVEAHIVQAQGMRQGETYRTLAGMEVSWTADGGVKTIHPGGIAVLQEIDTAVNGAIWVLDGVMD